MSECLGCNVSIIYFAIILTIVLAFGFHFLFSKIYYKIKGKENV